MISMSYPSTMSFTTSTPGPSYNYSYDSMFRLSGMTQSSTTIVNNVSYNLANQMLTMNYSGVSESRSYNVLNQLTNISVGTESLTYNYPTNGTNNGKVSSMNAIYSPTSGETVTYAYDSLNRLLSASSTAGWGQSYGFDGFGNLLSKTVTAGSGPSLSQAVSAATNQIVGQSYDANGNQYNGSQAYDVENRLTNTNGLTYAYDAQNKRIWSSTGAVDAYGNTTNYTVNVYSPSGQKLGAYLIAPAFFDNAQTMFVTVPSMQVTLSAGDQYFGGRRVSAMDQLGSVGNYFPWGEDKGGTSPQDTWNYATYWRDSVSGLDYANNRYYSNAYGRFMTPDLRKASLRPRNSTVARREKKQRTNPTNWNLYAYVSDDPVNNVDPNGTTCIPQNGVWADDGGGCGYVGDPISPSGSFNLLNTTGQSTVTTTVSFYCAAGYTGSDCSDTTIYGWLGLGQQVVQMVGQELNSVSVAGFTFAPAVAGSVGPAEGSVLVINTYDNSTGSSTSVLAEVGVADVAVGYEQNLTSGSQDTLVLAGLLPGNGSGVDLGFLGSGESGTFGFYFGIGDFGFGLDVSLGGAGDVGNGGGGDGEDDPE